MQYRKLGRTGFNVSSVSFGSWAIGGTWGTVNDDESMAALHTAVDQGINFFDTADVYGDGRSERLLARLKRERSEEIIIPTKVGRRLDPHTAEGYNRKNLTKFVDRSLKNLETDSLDLVQLHCPPWEVYYTPKCLVSWMIWYRLARFATTASVWKKSKKPSKRSNTQRQDRSDHLQHLPPAPG